ncbi:Fcf2-domain-containing protein [Ascobolus immersus RN42]|uniref:Fcf2-domain-containing protein n=1 Tax=Ascobolus immersus RN42 TaxID=1160509 RepID=A0A3N4IQF9_ASCIM|nr:Fcf2-domain-containing protein [Ascobolus immersus RN42]
MASFGGVTTSMVNDDLLSDEQLQQLLQQAHERLTNKDSGAQDVVMMDETPQVSYRFPKLDTGDLPKAPLRVNDKIVRAPADITVSDTDRKFAEKEVELQEPVEARRLRLKETKELTAGSNWFDMPRTDLTPELKRDLQILKMRAVIDPKRFYKKDKQAGFPKYSQVGTIVEGATEFFSARLTRKERKRNILDEVISDKKSRNRLKEKYQEVQSKNRSGRKDFYKKLKEQRKKKV